MPPKFFGPSWTGKSIAFDQPQSSSRKIVEKQDEKVHQLGSSDLNGLLGGSHISYAYARFICEDEQSGSRAFLRIYMQIPHAETMFEPVEVRAAQAKKIFHGEATAYLHFNKNGATHMPKSLGHKSEIQPRESNLVPGGYVEYIVWERLPGERLDGHGYWALEPSERDDIITAFKQAYAQVSASTRSIPVAYRTLQ